MKVSVIVPVHNSESHIRECLASLREQTFRDFEVICVDDGSSDRSPGILEEEAGRDPSMIVISQENRGVSAARNAGLDRAQGDYILFIDSDDLVRKNLLEDVLMEAQAQKAQMTIFGFGEYYGETDSFVPREICEDEALYGRAFSLRDLREASTSLVTPNVWRILFKRSFLDGHALRFHEELKTSEDLAFIYEALFVAERIALVKERLYLYRRDGGSTLTRNERGCAGFNALEAIKQFGESNGGLDRVRMYHLVNIVLDVAQYAMLSAYSWREFDELFARYKADWERFAIDNEALISPRYLPFFEEARLSTASEHLWALHLESQSTIESLRAENARLRQCLRASEESAEERRLEIERILSSHSFRIGRAIVKVPSSIKSAVLSTGKR